MAKKRQTYAQMERSHNNYLRRMTYAQFVQDYQGTTGVGGGSAYAAKIKKLHPRHWSRYQREHGGMRINDKTLRYEGYDPKRKRWVAVSGD